MEVEIDYHENHLRIKRNTRRIGRRKMTEINETAGRQMGIAIKEKKAKTREKVKRRNERRRKKRGKKEEKVRRRVPERSEVKFLKWKRRIRTRRRRVKITRARKRNF